MIFTLIDTKKETHEARSFYFRSDVPVSYRAGQHVNLRLKHDTPDERGTIRTFTLSSSPTEGDILSITTKQGTSSFKKALFDLPLGSTIEARGPGGGFVLQEQDLNHHILIAGGIGITPFRSMLTSLRDKKLNLSATLIYSNKTPHDIVFKDYLDQLSTLISLKVIHTITRPAESSSQWQGRVGRIDTQLIGDVSLPQSRYYIAGPSYFVEALVALVASTHVSSEHIHFEKFPGYAQ